MVSGSRVEWFQGRGLKTVIHKSVTACNLLAAYNSFSYWDADTVSVLMGSKEYTNEPSCNYQ